MHRRLCRESAQPSSSERPRRALALFGLVAVASLTASACATNPVTGKRELSLVSEQQEIAMGQQYAPQVAASMGLYEDAELQSYVEGLGLPMAQSSERPALPWQFRVVDDPAVNAFAVPGGFIYVTRGILAHMNSEGELVSVLGHEIGHVTAKHSVSQISRQQLAQIGLGIGTILLPPSMQGLGQIAGVGAQLIFLKYGRDDESQSDELGYRYMTEKGYDPREMVSMFQTLGRSSGGGEGRVPEWMSTHPWPENREAAIQELIRQQGGGAGASIVRRAEFLDKIDGIVFGADPKGGWFAGSRFHHPELRFRVDFPEGWATANQPQALVGLSPEKDAAMQLTLAAAPNAEEAARGFASQQNLQISSEGFQDASIRGLRALSGRFRAASQQGTVDGLIVFIEHEKKVYQLVGFAPTQAYSKYARTLENALFSFEREIDPAVLGAKPWRLDIVTPNRRLTIDEFARYYPGPVSTETLARINGKDPGDVFEPGVPAKRVVGKPRPGTQK